MSRRPADVVTTALAIFLLAACTAAPAASPTATSTAVAPTPTAAAETTGAATPAVPEPPAAELRLPDGTRVAGRIGSWCYANVCADIIIGPAEQQPRIELPKSQTALEASVAEPHSFVYWRASYRAADDQSSDMTILGEGGTRNSDPDVVEPPEATPLPEFSSATFPAPPSGEWLLEVRIQFPDGRGDAPYYWYAVVP